MKKFTITLIAILYLGVSSGASITFHYCIGQIISWSFSSKNLDNCKGCGNHTGDAKCCKNVRLELKTKSEQSKPDDSLLFGNFYHLQSSEAFNFKIAETYSTVLCGSVHSKDLRSTSVPIFIRNCTFQI
ncbi:hypothetical protein BDE36_1245 [Arcticibacter tournemirensis]|uniref:HYC_CC_PP family protein n=1 Tax=Arcticibacter tournemirensis TaxID=699437 RepID=UPI001166ABC8|nr:hypothetical protein BDE36_1245 [Arcticibacter tournemirensis]